MRASRTTPRHGVTLIELLIVIAIIGVLIGLLIPAVNAARNRVREAQTRNDIEQMSAAVASFKQNYNVPYIPSKIRLRNRLLDYSAPIDQLDVDSWNYLKRVWPRLTQIVPNSSPAVPYIINWCPNDGSAVPVANRSYVLEGDQCLVFFLGGSQQGQAVFGFGTADPRNPMNTTGAVVGPFYEFKVDRLKQLSHNGFPDIANASSPGGYILRAAGGNAFFLSYVDSYSAEATDTNYGVPEGQGMPYLYFSTRDAQNLYQTYNPSAGVFFGDCPTAVVGTSAVLPYLDATNKFSNPSGFQIISAGKNGKFGAGALSWGGPTAPYAGNREGEDDLTNFYNRPLGADR